jgi:hypothetical protein
MQSLPEGQGQDGRGQEQPIDAGQLGTRDVGKTTLNREGLFVMAKQPKTNDELLADIRRSAREVRDVEYAIPIVGSMPLWQIKELESYSNALAIYCKLLRQRLEAGQTTLTEGK